MSGQGSQRVLLVDDCPANRRLCEKLLEREGFATVHAENGAEALVAARSELPHTILMDVMMPVMDGLEATRLLREDPVTASIPIIIVSAKTEEVDLAAGLTAGADEYVFKPIKAREFRLRVRSMVRLREAQLATERANASLRRRAALLSELNQFSEILLATAPIDVIHRQIVEGAAKLMNSNRVSLLVPSAEGEALRFACALGIEERFWRDMIVPLTSPVAGRVFQTAEEMVVTTTEEQLDTSGTYESDAFASLPLICTPLRGQHGALGVLNVTGRQDSPEYHPDEIDALRQFCHMATLALGAAVTRAKLDETRDSIINSMARLSEFRHQETGQHIERVAELAALLARRLAEDPRVPNTIDAQFISDLRRAAPLHDIGKVGIPDRILLKPGKLTDAEFEVMKGHSRIGADTLRSAMASGHETSFLSMAVDIALHHHERYDGRGYPDRLAGDDIPLSARIVCLADTYDAIRMKRDYKPARTHEDATAEILRMSGQQFDPRIVDAYLARAEEFRDTYDRLAENEEVVQTESAQVLAAVGAMG